MRFEQLLAEFKQLMGIEDLTSDDSGICRFVLDGSALVALEETSDRQGFYLYSTVGAIPQAKEKTLGLQALSGNLFGKETGKASLGYLPDSNMLVLFEYIPIEGTTVENLKQRLEEFLAYLKVWHEKLETTTSPQGAMQQSQLAPRSGGMQIFFA